MADLGSLVVQLEANMAQFNSGMNESAERVENAMGRIDVATDMAVGALKALASVGTVAMLAAIVKEAIDAADNLGDMSQATGVAVVDLNGLAFAAGQAGGSLESMVGAAGKLNLNIASAASGTGDAAKTFKTLGISVTDASGSLKKADVVMAEVADQFAKYQDGPEKAALAVALFGKSGTDMIPILNEGGDALRENSEYAKKYSGMTSDLQQKSDEFNTMMGKLTVQQNSFGNAMATAVLPVINAVASEILGATENTDKWSLASTVIRTVLETFVVVGAEVAHTFKMVGDEIGGRFAQLGALANFDYTGFKGIGAAMKQDQAQALIDHEAFIKKILDRTPATVTDDGKPAVKPPAPKFGGGGRSGNSKPAVSEADKLEEEGKRIVARLREQDEAFGKSATEALELQLSRSKIPQSLKDEAIAYQASIEAKKKNAEDRKKIDADQAARDQEAARAKVQNESNVEQIRASLLTEAQAEAEVHQARIDELVSFHNANYENTVLANQLMEEETARHEQAKKDIRIANDMAILAAVGNSTDQLYSLLQQAGAEQTALGKAVFLASKAIAVAEIIMNTEVAAAKAQAQFGAFGTPIAMGIRVAGYASAGLVAGMAIAEASAENGYDIPAGANPVTQLHEREMVLPRAQADVIRGLAAGGGGGGEMKFTIVNQTTGRIDKVVEQRISATERALIIQEATAATAAQFSDPNSQTSRSLGRNYNIPRSR